MLARTVYLAKDALKGWATESYERQKMRVNGQANQSCSKTYATAVRLHRPHTHRGLLALQPFAQKAKLRSCGKLGNSE
eukprot:2273483-Amphidinium_carterae.1